MKFIYYVTCGNYNTAFKNIEPRARIRSLSGLNVHRFRIPNLPVHRFSETRNCFHALHVFEISSDDIYEIVFVVNVKLIKINMIYHR